MRWQVATLLEELKPASVRDSTALPDTSVLNSLTAMQQRTESRFIGKLSVLPSKLAETVLAQKSGDLIHAHALSGVVWVHDNDTLPDGTR